MTIIVALRISRLRHTSQSHEPLYRRRFAVRAPVLPASEVGWTRGGAYRRRISNASQRRPIPDPPRMSGGDRLPSPSSRARPSYFYIASEKLRRVPRKTTNNGTTPQGRSSRRGDPYRLGDVAVFVEPGRRRGSAQQRPTPAITSPWGDGVYQSTDGGYERGRSAICCVSSGYISAVSSFTPRIPTSFMLPATGPIVGAEWQAGATSTRPPTAGDLETGQAKLDEDTGFVDLGDGPRRSWRRCNRCSLRCACNALASGNPDHAVRHRRL